MEFLRPTADGRSLERILEAADHRLGARITVHDHAELLIDEDGRSLLPRMRSMHGHPFCDHGRRPGSACDRACNRHCLTAVNAAIRTADAPVVHQCWKGGSELAVPIRTDGTHLLTLFAGVWRGAPAAPAMKGLPALAPPPPRHELDDLTHLVTALGHELIRVAGSLKSRQDSVDRGTRVRALIRDQVDQGLPPSLGDAARIIGVSKSRAAHVIRESCGKPFRALVADARIRRARMLLATTPATAAEVAEAVGYASEHHFNRRFRADTGLPPGQWRSELRRRG